MRKLLPLLGLVLVGCGMNPGQNADPIDVRGKITVAGRPVNDVTLNFQPTGNGSEAKLPVKNGEFQGKLTPGRYTYYLSEGARPAALDAVPAKYRAGAMDRQIDIESGSQLTLTLD